MSRVREIAKVFLKLGCIAFGGPAAHIAMMEREVVTERQWMDRQHFLDLVGATNLIPGPNSTEMAMHCGYHRAGRIGLVVAGLCFLGPAILLTLVWAHLYQTFGSTPAFLPVLKGIQSAVLIIILGAVFRLSRKALKSWEIAMIGGMVLVLALSGFNEILLLFSGGILGAAWLLMAKKRRGLNCVSPIFFIFLKIGAVLYGSGYLLIAYLEAEFVDQRGWLTYQQLLDAVAVGQMTPGPVLSTATFVGYQLQGLPGALVATAGIFLPSFLFVYFLNPLVSKMRGQPVAAAFLDSVNISAVSLMLAVCAKLMLQILTDIPGLILLSVLGMFFIVIPKLGPVGLIGLGGAAGLLAEWARFW